MMMICKGKTLRTRVFFGLRVFYKPGLIASSVIPQIQDSVVIITDMMVSYQGKIDMTNTTSMVDSPIAKATHFGRSRR